MTAALYLPPGATDDSLKLSRRKIIKHCPGLSRSLRGKKGNEGVDNIQH